jgi:hypothetical protein
MSGTDNDELSISAYDVEVFRTRQKAEEKELERRHKRTIKRWTIIGGSIAALSMSAAAVGVAYIIWMGVRGPSASEVLENQQRAQCIQEHGNWIKIDTTDDDSSYAEGVCWFGEAR